MRSCKPPALVSTCSQPNRLGTLEPERASGFVHLRAHAGNFNKVTCDAERGNNLHIRKSTHVLRCSFGLFTGIFLCLVMILNPASLLCQDTEKWGRSVQSGCSKASFARLPYRLIFSWGVYQNKWGGGGLDSVLVLQFPPQLLPLSGRWKMACWGWWERVALAEIQGQALTKGPNWGKELLHPASPQADPFLTQHFPRRCAFSFCW